MKFFCLKGATPIDDISDLKPKWIKTMEDLNQAEAENISDATNKHLLRSISSPLNWFTVQTFMKIHRDMFFDVWNWAGKFRSTQTNPGIKPYQIGGALEELCRDVFFWCNESCELTFVEQAARIHHRLVFIHPFPNGNGRFSRLISDRYLKAKKCPFPNWPRELSLDGESRKEYIKALKESDRGCYESLILYMKKHGARNFPLS